MIIDTIALHFVCAASIIVGLLLVCSAFEPERNRIERAILLVPGIPLTIMAILLFFLILVGAVR